MSTATGLLVPVSTEGTTPFSVATPAIDSRAPGSSRPSTASWSRWAVSASANRALNGASSSAELASRRSTPFRAMASKKISGSVRPAICGSFTSGRPVTVRNAAANATRETFATSTSVRSMFHRTNR